MVVGQPAWLLQAPARLPAPWAFHCLGQASPMRAAHSLGWSRPTKGGRRRVRLAEEVVGMLSARVGRSLEGGYGPKASALFHTGGNP